jgi:hypothetical protein
MERVVGDFGVVRSSDRDLLCITLFKTKVVTRVAFEFKA